MRLRPQHVRQVLAGVCWEAQPSVLPTEGTRVGGCGQVPSAAMQHLCIFDCQSWGKQRAPPCWRRLFLHRAVPHDDPEHSSKCHLL